MVRPVRPVLRALWEENEFSLLGFGAGGRLGVGSVGGELGFGGLAHGSAAGSSVRHLIAP